MKQRPEEHGPYPPQLFELIQEQKRINQGIINHLESVNFASPLSNDIRYLKVLLSSSTHITNSLMEAVKQILGQKKE
ncbi:hypothetical protein ABE068_06015 [Bacillus glycinifermentans]|uniref:Uncharacterized protein n=1 Tax=Bacillus glycinifermentans TaxID=1664069 RepID=A0A0T6BKT0_9BACI|nr:hypothetical protein [Bacillus glycinifermentans]KRT90424.1 hypothetical protein AB447_207550 [Bacillus glycinifermentans]MEC0484129.1 hypothetical protein [Bacillus glycinifermentans]